jgi:hypothetical protein
VCDVHVFAREMMSLVGLCDEQKRKADVKWQEMKWKRSEVEVFSACLFSRVALSLPTRLLHLLRSPQLHGVSNFTIASCAKTRHAVAIKMHNTFHMTDKSTEKR